MEKVTAEFGADFGRRLNLAVVHGGNDEDEQQFSLRAGGGEVLLQLQRTGHFFAAYGTATIKCENRDIGSAFVDELSRWVGKPLEPAEKSGASGQSTSPIKGDYTELGTLVDAEGNQWKRIKLSLRGKKGSAPGAELYLTIDNDNQRACFSEKDWDNRAPLLQLFDNALGSKRKVSVRKTVGIKRTATHVSVPPDWIISESEMYIGASDPNSSCTFECTYFPSEGLKPSVEAARKVLCFVLEKQFGTTEQFANIVDVDRGDMSLSWAACPPPTDQVSGSSRYEEISCVLIAVGNNGYAIATFTFAPRDAALAYQEWNRIRDSMSLGE
jgi:hypothetical protein